MGSGKNELQIILGNLVGAAQENTPGLINARIHRISLDQPLDLLVERLLVRTRLLIQDDEVDHQAMLTQVGMRLEHLAYKANILHLPDAHNCNGQISGDAIWPQRRLALLITLDAFERRS